MERDQENMQFLGLVGIYQESYMIMASWRKIFSLITLTLILPLSLTILFEMEVSPLFFGDISYYPKPHFVPPIHPRHTDGTISSQLLLFILIKLAYFVLMGCFSLDATSAVVYTVISAYAGRDGVTFKNVMSFVPKVWKRLAITFVFTFLAFFVYNVVVGLVIFIWAIMIREKNYCDAIYVVILVIGSLGFLYLTAIWQLANVVSMLEDSCGFKAMMKSNKLIKGKKVLSIIINNMFYISFIPIHQLLFSEVVVNGWKLQVDVGFVWRIVFGVFCVLVYSFMFLLMLVVQTVLYFVCKSYHHEIIDKSALSEHLEVLYQGDH